MGKIGRGCRPHLKRSHFYPGGKDDDGLGDGDGLNDVDDLGDDGDGDNGEDIDDGGM